MLDIKELTWEHHKNAERQDFVRLLMSGKFFRIPRIPSGLGFGITPNCVDKSLFLSLVSSSLSGS